MPQNAPSPFLLWHDAAQSGRWGKLMKKKLTRDRWIAISLLQAYPPYHSGMTAGTSAEDRAKKAIADGWGQ